MLNSLIANESELKLKCILSVSLPGRHVVQMRTGCEWLEDGDMTGFMLLGYDGEGIALDQQTGTWLKSVDDDIFRFSDESEGINGDAYPCPALLKLTVQYGRSSLLRTGEVTVSTVMYLILLKLNINALY